MDHFPPVADPYQPLEIPYPGSGWDSEDEVHSDGSGNHVSRVEELKVIGRMQENMFFSMLSGVFQLDVAKSDYTAVGKNTGAKILSTRMLRRHLQAWKTKHDTLRAWSHSKDHGASQGPGATDAIKELDERRKKTENCLSEAYNTWCELDTRFGKIEGEISKEIREAVLRVRLSIQILGTTLEHAIQSVSQHCDTCAYEPWVNTFSVPWRRHKSNSFLENRMATQGWCPSVVESLRKQGGLSLIYYTSLLGLPARVGHIDARCKSSDPGCCMTNIRNFAYEPKHTKECTGCEFLWPDPGIDCISDIIEKGGIPVLYLDDEDKLKVVAQKRGIEYTAISHV
jgi:hypothetical protein